MVVLGIHGVIARLAKLHAPNCRAPGRVPLGLNALAVERTFTLVRHMMNGEAGHNDVKQRRVRAVADRGCAR